MTVWQEGHSLQKSLLRFEEDLVTRLYTTSIIPSPLMCHALPSMLVNVLRCAVRS